MLKELEDFRRFPQIENNSDHPNLKLRFSHEFMRFQEPDADMVGNFHLLEIWISQRDDDTIQSREEKKTITVVNSTTQRNYYSRIALLSLFFLAQITVVELHSL